MHSIKLLFLSLICITTFNLQAQDDLLAELEEERADEVDYVLATWKGTKVVNLQTNELPGKGVLQYTILHRFGAFNQDFVYNFFGLNNAQVRLTLDYSPLDWLNLGLGHSGVNKVYDGFAKYRLLRQSKGAKNVPISITGFSGIYYTNLRDLEGELQRNTTQRLSYVQQIVIARKFNQNFSAQIVPTVTHFNLAEFANQENTMFQLGLAARYKITPMVAITAEYIPMLNGRTFSFSNAQDQIVEDSFDNALSVGVDIETGGHVFQLFITNARGVAEPFVFARNRGTWANGDLHFGFNISRVFTLKKPAGLE